MKKLYSARFAVTCLALVAVLMGTNAAMGQDVTATITGR